MPTNQANKKKLIIHIGSHKTGTTALQETLCQNAELLLQNDILYPAAAQRFSAHHPLTWPLVKPQAATTELLALPAWKGFIAEAAQTPASTIVISSENFSRLKQPAILKPLAELFDVSILFYMRQPHAYVESYYNQLIKDGKSRETRTITEYVDELPLFYLDNLAVINRWAKVFGEEKIVPRIYARENFPDTGIVGDALSALQIDTELAKDFEQPRSTPIAHKTSLSPDLLDFLRIMNSTSQHDEKSQYNLVIRLQEINSSATGDEYRTSRCGQLTLEQKRDVTERYLKQNRIVARKFLGLDDTPFRVENIHHDPGIDSKQETIDIYGMAKIVAQLL